MSRKERLEADLERGFAALEEGKLDVAASILDRCRRIDRKHPDVLLLGGRVAEARGEPEEAMAQYAALAAQTPDDPMPMICMAHIELHHREDPDAALDHLEKAFDFIDEEAELIEAIFLKTEALLAREDLEEARATLGELAASVIEDGDLALDLAALAIAAEDPKAAARWADVARSSSPELEAEALHVLGRAHELAGDRPAMIAAWQEVRRLDLKAPPGEVHVTEDEIEKIASEALAELPQKIREHLERVPILIDDLPSEDIVADGFDPRLLGLFQGTPMPEDGALAPSVTNILLFKRNLERFAEDEAHLAEEVRITVLHETAHYFGLDEDDLAAIGLD
jgi:predicted Zn-dependent protease with MMP-like domain/thioredoxin-like negative regulator of GroEL